MKIIIENNQTAATVNTGAMEATTGYRILRNPPAAIADAGRVRVGAGCLRR